jgi:molecular chaperone DnaK
MTSYVGIDLGTTNSAICSYDGETLQIYKSPEQNDVTPSALFIDKRGNRFVGLRAYTNAARNPDNAATLFKRLIGTSTVLKLPAVGIELTPEQCSAEILKVLFGYLPEAIRKDDSSGTVITVPAAFNQMQKDATLSAAEMAAIGQVSLMQEPVAAVMAVMRKRKSDGNFLVFDFGGGTLDIAVAESTKGRVSLLSHGGIAMCGGRDFDLALFNEVVAPWLREKFSLPKDFTTSVKYRSLTRLNLWAAERAKITLSSADEASISLSESELGMRDEAGEEIYLDIALDRSRFNELIEGKLSESLEAARDTLLKAGLPADSIERIVFVGGPTQYKPLRDRICRGLGIAGSTDVNPMTAVAEGAALFAESIDWASQSRGRKSTRGALVAKSAISVEFAFLARTSVAKTKVMLKVDRPAPGSEFQLDSLDTGWSSGRLALRDAASVEVPLSKAGENTFKIFLFDAHGGSVSLEPSKFVITRTAATIDAIPSSSSLAFEVQDRASGRATLVFIIKEGEPVPKKGSLKFQATTALRAGGEGALRFKLWEGEITDRVTDNRFIGELTVTGDSFESGKVIPAGAELVCEYEVHDSGNVNFNVSVPAIAASFTSKRNLYSRQAAQIDFAHAGQRVQEDAAALRKRLTDMAARIQDQRLKQIDGKLAEAEEMAPEEADPERAKLAMDRLLEAKKLLAQVRRDRLKQMRQLELDSCVDFFNKAIRSLARAAEVSAYETLIATAQRAIERIDTSEFEEKLAQLRGRNFEVLWREDWFVLDRFKRRSEEAHLFADPAAFAELIDRGQQAISADKLDELRRVVYTLDSLRMGEAADEDIMASSNLVKL